MKESFRQSMSWLHTWVGLVTGWVLFFVFVTGTATYFKDEITRWMKPELPLAAPVENHPSTAAMVNLAVNYLARQPEAARQWNIDLPKDGSRVGYAQCGGECPKYPALRGYPSPLTVRWAGNEIWLDSRTGKELPPLPATRDTGGGNAFETMHLALHYVERGTGTWIVGIAAMLGLVAIVTGVIVHKKIFKDFFTFRPRKGQRSWLDGHNVVSVMALPFFVMITYSGLHLQGYVPDPLIDPPPAHREAGPISYPQPVSRPPVAMASIVVQSEKILGPGEISNIEFSNLSDKGPRIFVNRRWGTEYPFASRYGSDLNFDAATGRFLNIPRTHGQPPAWKGMWWMVGAHFGWFAGAGLRWLYFASGLLGCAMIATGLVLWTVKRKEKHARSGNLPVGVKLVEWLNVGTIIGLPIGVAAYFWANRLLPTGLFERAEWEAHALFLTWGWMLLYAAFRPARRAWVELCGLAALAFGLIPVLNALTTDKHLAATIAQGDWVLAGFDLTMLGLAATFGGLGWKLHRQSAASAGGKAMPAPRAGEAMA